MTALPKTSWAQVKAPAGVTLISLEINRRSRLSHGQSLSRGGPQTDRAAIGIGRSVSNPKRDQTSLHNAGGIPGRPGAQDGHAHEERMHNPCR